MLIAEIVDTDLAAVIASIVAALGGLQGVRTLIKRAGKLVEIAETMEEKSKKLDEMCGVLENHSLRMADLERGVLAFNNFENRLDRYEAQLNAIVEASDHGVWISDSSGLCIACNEALTVLMMCPKDAIIGASWKDAIHPDDRDRVVSRWMDFVRGERSVFQTDYRYQSPDGRVNAVHGVAIKPMVNGIRADRIYGWAKLIAPKGT